jgi:hypothetical protein
MNQYARITASPDSALRLDDLDDSQILDLIARAGSDPLSARNLLHLQKQACARMAASIQLVLGELNDLDKAPAKKTAGPVSVLALAGAARQREAAGKQKRAFAEFLVIGALKNGDNPGWNVFDPASAAPAPAPNGLLALMQMKLPAPASGAD